MFSLIATGLKKYIHFCGETANCELLCPLFEFQTLKFCQKSNSNSWHSQNHNKLKALIGAESCLEMRVRKLYVHPAPGAVHHPNQTYFKLKDFSRTT